MKKSRRQLDSAIDEGDGCHPHDSNSRIQGDGVTNTKRWGIVLAGGDGTRIRELTQSISGDDRPKQFCRLLGSRTLLEDTRRRAEEIILPENILYSLTKKHCEYFPEFLEDRPFQQIIQPHNRGTAPAIISTLLEIFCRDPNAVVAILPCDHYYSDEGLFSEALEHAFRLAKVNLDSIVVLGVPPARAETGYGWIELGEPSCNSENCFRVKAFHEKPSKKIADRLYHGDSLVNTFVMVGGVAAFLDVVAETLPGLLNAFLPALDSASGGVKTADFEHIYSNLGVVDFSTKVLSLGAERLIALRLDDHGWSDLGDPCRVIEVLNQKAPEDVPDWFLKRKAVSRSSVFANIKLGK